MTIQINVNVALGAPEGIDIRHHFPDGGAPNLAQLLAQLQGQLVSSLGGKIADVATSVDAAVGGLGDRLAALQGQLAALEAAVAGAPADLAALDELKRRVDAIDPPRPP